MLKMTRTLAAAAMAAPLALGAVAAKAADIVDTAVSAGQFQTLVAAVQAADLVAALKSEGPFTVFAPTDEAFAKLPEGTVESLLQPENKEKLVAVLTYHVVPGKIVYNDVQGAVARPETLQGGTVTVDGTYAGPTINGANIVGPDVMADNGVIHVIDQVILPPNM